MLANAEFHPDASAPDTTSSRASSLPNRALAVPEISVQTEFHLWERACSRMRCVIQMHQCLTGPLREQARSHIGPWPWRRFRSKPNSICGSELARECGVSSRCISAWQDPFASRLAPTWGLGRGGDFGPNRIPFVGASLLANAEFHPDASVPDRTSSRAGSLPQGALVVPKISVQTEFHLWERACSRRRQSIRRISVRSPPSHPPALCTRQCSPATATGAVAR